MDETLDTKEEVEIKEETPIVPDVVPEVAPAAPVAAPKEFVDSRRGGQGGQGARGGKRFGGKGGRREPRRGYERQKPEFDQKMIDVRRVTRVVAGGRRFSFSVVVALGDHKGRAGLGFGKATDTSLAIDKAVKSAKKTMITLRLNKKHSIPFDIDAKYASSKISIMPNRGKGLIAGSSARTILNLAGVRDVTAKYNSGSKNKLNNAKVCMEALRKVAYARGEVPMQKKEKKEDVKEAEVQ